LRTQLQQHIYPNEQRAKGNDMNRLVFLDIETGGLAGLLENGHMGCQYYPIFQVALIVTDLQLREIAPPLDIYIYQSEDMIARSHEWAIDQHTKSGVLDKSRKFGIELADAEKQILDYFKELGIEAYDRKEKTGAAMAGNSILLDRMFISAQMPKLDAYLHYRQMDISAVNMLGRAMGADLMEGITKTYSHDAIQDIRECLHEARHYCKQLFKADI
jgi:oligoribonuclease